MYHIWRKLRKTAFSRTSVFTGRVNKATKYATENRISLNMPTLYKDFLCDVGLIDVSFECNNDLSYLLFDRSRNVVPVYLLKFSLDAVVTLFAGASFRESPR